MKNLIIALISIFTLVSCTTEKKPEIQQIPVRDYGTQYNADLILIENYLKTHSVTVINNAGFPDDQDATFALVPSLDATSMWGSNSTTPKPSLLTKLVTANGVSQKIYYIKFRDGIGASATLNSVIRVVYDGGIINEPFISFDKSVNSGIILSLNNVISGWQQIIPEFKMGTITGTNQYADFGAGAMFLPSTLAYFNQSRAGIPSYSPLIFTVKLYNIL